MPIYSKPLPPLALLLAAFRYDPETGRFYNRVNRGQRVKIGEEAGSKSKGSDWNYRIITFDSVNYKAHRVAWLMWHGYDPGEYLVDHINGDTMDNRACNLRLATNQQNTWNSKQKISRSGEKNVRQVRGKWVARISKNGVRTHVGTYDNKPDAVAAHALAAADAHGDFYRKTA